MLHALSTSFGSSLKTKQLSKLSGNLATPRTEREKCRSAGPAEGPQGGRVLRNEERSWGGPVSPRGRPQAHERAARPAGGGARTGSRTQHDDRSQQYPRQPLGAAVQRPAGPACSHATIPTALLRHAGAGLGVGAQSWTACQQCPQLRDYCCVAACESMGQQETLAPQQNGPYSITSSAEARWCRTQVSVGDRDRRR